MTSPVNNANFTTPAARDTRQPSGRQDANGEPKQTTAAPARDDSVTLSGRTAAPAASDSRIQSSDDARAVLDRVKQRLSDNPAGAIAAHGNIDAKSAAGALSLSA